jgi:bla regulator protein BlaR1
MSSPLWFQNLLAYSLQITVLAAAGLLMPRLLRLHSPRLLYAYWQALLAACLLLPLVQPWQHFEAGRGGTAASRILLDSGAVAARLATFPATGMVLLVLASGAVLRLAWLALGIAKLTRCRRSAHRYEPLPNVIQEIQRRLDVEPEFCLSNEIQGPVTFGIWRPVILLPPRCLEMDADHHQAIASHELLHVARRDWAFNLAEEIVLAGFWFHPAVWWLVSRIRLSREQVVDRQVVELTGARKPYLYALVEIAAAAGASRAIAAPAFLNECQLAERIRTLLKEDFMSKRRIAVTLVGVTALTLLAGLASVRAFPLKASLAAPDSPSPGLAAAKDDKKDKNVTLPVPIYKPEPPYTKEAKDAKLQGIVTLWAVVAPDGTVRKVELVHGLGKGLDESALKTIKTWKFKPAMKAGKPVPRKVMVEVGFRFY